MQSLRKIAKQRVEMLQNVATLNIRQRVLVTCFLCGVTSPSKIAAWIRIILPMIPSKQKPHQGERVTLAGAVEFGIAPCIL